MRPARTIALTCVLAACGGPARPEARAPEPAAAAAPGPAVARPSTGSEPSEPAVDGPPPIAIDPAWEAVAMQSFGEQRGESQFFVDETGERVLRVDPEGGGWWSLDDHRLTPIPGLHGTTLLFPGVASADLGVYAHLVHDRSGDSRRPVVEVWAPLSAAPRRHPLREMPLPTHFASGGHAIALIDEGGTVRVFDRSGMHIGPRLTRFPVAFAMSHDGETFASWSAVSGQARVSRAGHVVDVTPPEAPEGTDYFAMALREDGSAVAFATWGHVRVVDLQTERVLMDRTFTEGDSPIGAIAFGPDGQLVASDVSDRSAAILEGARTVPLPHLHLGRVPELRWTPRGIYGFGRDTLIRWIDGAQDLTLMRSLEGTSWRPREAPLVEVIGLARVVVDVRTGRVTEGEVLDDDDFFARHRWSRRACGVDADDAAFAAAAADELFLLDESADGTRRVVAPRAGHSRLVDAASSDVIATVNAALSERLFSSDGSWLATPTSYREGEQEIVVLRSTDAQELARARIVDGYRDDGYPRRIQAMTVLESDHIVTRTETGVVVHRFADGELTEVARHDAPSTGWRVVATELLLAVPSGEDTVVRRLALPGLEAIGETRLEGVSEPALDYFPDGRRIGALSGGRMTVGPLPGSEW